MAIVIMTPLASQLTDPRLRSGLALGSSEETQVAQAWSPASARGQPKQPSNFTLKGIQMLPPPRADGLLAS